MYVPQLSVHTLPGYTEHRGGRSAAELLADLERVAAG